MTVFRPYQTHSYDSWLRDLERFDSSLLVLATGLGKTVVFARMASSWDRGNVLILVHRKELAYQARDKLTAELGYAPSIEMGVEGMDTENLWQGGVPIVGSVQTMVNDKRLEKFRSTPFGLIIIDEAHHAVAASYGKVIQFFRDINPGLKVAGVTATPDRTDEVALGLVFQSCAYRMGIRDAIDDGWLVPIEQQYIVVEDLDFSGVATNKSGPDKGDMKAADLEAILIQEGPLHGMVGPMIEKVGQRQCLAFTAGVAQAHMTAGILNRHRQGCAVAIDGETDPQQRKEIVKAYCDGQLQYLLNFGVFVEGFDAPPTSVVAMGRPTKSRALYEQMLGRGTRPLPGVVDGPDTAELRRAAIAASMKPSLLVLDFVGNSEHKLVSTVDVLGGKYDAEVRQLAARDMQAGGRDPMAALRKAAARLALLKEEEKRKEIKAGVRYQNQAVDPFGHDSPGVAHSNHRGGATDAQIAFLVNLGVNQDTAAGYGKSQAGAVITSLKEKRCTIKQEAILKRHGFNHAVPFDEAGAIITKIADSGWTLRGDK